MKAMTESASNPSIDQKKAVEPRLEMTARVRKLMDHWEAQADLDIFLTAEELCLHDMDIVDRVRDQIDSLHAMTRIMTGMTGATDTMSTLEENSRVDRSTMIPSLSELDIVAAQGLGLIPQSRQGGSDESPRLIVGRYSLESFIAQGAHGQVWQAFDPELQRRVALKMTRPERMARLSAHLRYVEQYRLIE
ncbi:MAG: hypothetical protein NT172_09480, partial [Planctomycetota bacterium]|nr:hypothetical protein [Planctomycetota bacterium]